MPVVEVNHLSTLREGGAGIAAERLHDALLAQGVNSHMTLLRGGDTATQSVFTPKKGAKRTLQREAARFIRRRAADQVNGLASLGMVESGLAAHLNGQARQVLNLHWVNGDMISIAEIGRLLHPVVWTLHDMWPFCGAEHYTETLRWQHGYADRKGGALRDMNAWVWGRKARHWRRPMHIVAPSRWLAACASDSELMRDWPVRVIPNAIDMSIWRPIDQQAARAALDLPPDVPLVLVGAMGGRSDPRKGYAHLRAALLRLHDQGRHLHLLVFGGGTTEQDLPFPVHDVGAVDDVEKLRLIYAAADAFALPSRQDNLPNTGVEALASGTPVVGFKIGGLPDLVCNRLLGALAPAFDDERFATALAEVLDQQSGDPGRGRETGTAMARAARAHATRTYAAPVVARQYFEFYQEITDAG